VALAMIEAAWPPATVREICGRAQWEGASGVGRRLGQVTATRLVAAGELVVLDVAMHARATAPRRGRPARVVAARERLRQAEPAAQERGAAEALCEAWGIRAMGSR
jgi:hypothetical protein